MNAEGRRLVAARAQEAPGGSGGRISASASGEPSARTTAPAATPGPTLSHDLSRSFAYRWGEDGIAGISDDARRSASRSRCGTAGSDRQGTPVRTHQPRGQPRRGREGVLLLSRQHADTLVHAVPLQVPAGARFRTRSWSRPTARRSRTELEYELIDTGVFDDDRYFDVFVEYAKAAPEDLRSRSPRYNRGPEPATLHLLPTLWFRNTWRHATRDAPVDPGGRDRGHGAARPSSAHARQVRSLAARAAPSSCSPTTRRTSARIAGDRTGDRRYFKDGINDYLVDGRNGAINPEQAGRRRPRTTRLPIAPGGQRRSGCA